VTAVSLLSRHIRRIYKHTRFSIGDHTWPPEQPQDFTPLVLLHYKKQRTAQDTTTIITRLHSGGIHDVISATSSNHPNNQPLKSALQYSDVTKKAADVLEVFEHSNSPQTVLIEGAPGIGKSILMKHIAYSWAEGEILAKFQLVFLVYLRDPVIQNIKSFRGLLQSFYKRVTDDEDIAVCSKCLVQDGGKTVTFLLDGYDEFPEELRENSLIADILNRYVLPECGLVISSRPHASMHIHKKATLKVDILGFTEIEQDHFIQRSLKEQPDKIIQLTTYLQNHWTINSLCFSPFYMVVLIFICKQEHSLPRSLTELYEKLICLTICRHLVKCGDTVAASSVITDFYKLPFPWDEIIKQLAKLSLHGLNNNQLIFTLTEIKTFCPQLELVPGAINGFGLLQVVEHIGIFKATKSFSFIHVTMQEFLAAYHITLLPPEEELSMLEKYFWSDIHTNMFNIYTALTKGQTPMFKQFVCNDDGTINNEFLNDKMKCLHLYQRLYEAGNKQMCLAIEKMFSDEEIYLWGITLSRSDLGAVTTMLTCSSIKQWKELELSSCCIQDHGIQLLHHSLMYSGVTIEELRLGNNGLSSFADNGLCDIVISCEVKALEISYNKTVGETNEFFSRILMHPSSRIEILYMIGNSYSSSVAVQLFTSLKDNTTLKRLVVMDNEITDEACSSICAALQVNNTLWLLNIWGNPITEKSLQLIVNSLHSNNSLELLWLPKYNEIYTTITLLQKVVNKN